MDGNQYLGLGQALREIRAAGVCGGERARQIGGGRLGDSEALGGGGGGGLARGPPRNRG